MEPSANGLNSIIKKIERCGEKITVWNKEKFGHVKQGIERARTELQLLQSSDPLPKKG